MKFFIMILILSKIYFGMTLLNIHQRTLLERCHDLQKDGGIEVDCSKLLKKGNNDKNDQNDLDEIEEEVDENISHMLQLKEKIKKFRKKHLRGTIDTIQPIKNEMNTNIDPILQSVISSNKIAEKMNKIDEIDKQIEVLNQFKINS